MRKRKGNANLPKESVLKIDKDCHVAAKLNYEMVQNIIDTCGKRGLNTLWIKTTRTAHGRHFYIKIDLPIEAEETNDLQYLLGDDAKRYAFNKARIESGLPEWNKLFEKPAAGLTRIYNRKVRSRTKTARARH